MLSNDFYMGDPQHMLVKDKSDDKQEALLNKKKKKKKSQKATAAMSLGEFVGAEGVDDGDELQAVDGSGAVLTNHHPSAALRAQIEQFDAEYQSRQDAIAAFNSPILAALKDNVMSMFQGILKESGPLYVRSDRLTRFISDLPQEAQDALKACKGNLGTFLSQHSPLIFVQDGDIVALKEHADQIPQAQTEHKKLMEGTGGSEGMLISREVKEMMDKAKQTPQSSSAADSEKTKMYMAARERNWYNSRPPNYPVVSRGVLSTPMGPVLATQVGSVVTTPVGPILATPAGPVVATSIGPIPVNAMPQPQLVTSAGPGVPVFTPTDPGVSIPVSRAFSTNSHTSLDSGLFDQSSLQTDGDEDQIGGEECDETSGQSTASSGLGKGSAVGSERNKMENVGQEDETCEEVPEESEDLDATIAEDGIDNGDDFFKRTVKEWAERKSEDSASGGNTFTRAAGEWADHRQTDKEGADNPEDDVNEDGGIFKETDTELTDHTTDVDADVPQKLLAAASGESMPGDGEQFSNGVKEFSTGELRVTAKEFIPSSAYGFTGLSSDGTGHTPQPSDTTPLSSDIIPQPSDITSHPSNITPLSSDITPLPSDITPQPSDITPLSSDITPQPSDITPLPSGITPQPSDITPQPSDITPQPSDITPLPSDITPLPSDITPQPSDITPLPSDITPLPSDITPQPSDITPQPSGTVSDQHGDNLGGAVRLPPGLFLSSDTSVSTAAPVADERKAQVPGHSASSVPPSLPEPSGSTAAPSGLTSALLRTPVGFSGAPPGLPNALTSAPPGLPNALTSGLPGLASAPPGLSSSLPGLYESSGGLPDVPPPGFSGPTSGLSLGSSLSMSRSMSSASVSDSGQDVGQGNSNSISKDSKSVQCELDQAEQMLLNPDSYGSVALNDMVGGMASSGLNLDDVNANLRWVNDQLGNTDQSEVLEENRKLQEEMGHVQSELERVQGELTDQRDRLTQEKSKYHTELKRRSDKAEELQDQLMSKIGEVKDLRTKINYYEKKHRGEVKALQDELKSLRIELASKKFMEMERKLNEAKEEATKSGQDIEALTARVDQLSQKSCKSSEEVSRQKARAVQAEVELEKSRCEPIIQNLVKEVSEANALVQNVSELILKPMPQAQRSPLQSHRIKWAQYRDLVEAILKDVRQQLQVRVSALLEGQELGAMVPLRPLKNFPERPETDLRRLGSLLGKHPFMGSLTFPALDPVQSSATPGSQPSVPTSKNPGQPPIGSKPPSQPPIGSKTPGQPPIGSKPPGQPPIGSRPVGPAPISSQASGQPPIGSRPSAAPPMMNSRPPGQPLIGSRPLAQSPIGSRPSAQPPIASRPANQPPAGTKATGQPAPVNSKATGQPAPVNSKQPTSQFDRLVAMVAERLPNVPRLELISVLTKVRAMHGNTLSGMTKEQIVKAVALTHMQNVHSKNGYNPPRMAIQRYTNSPGAPAARASPVIGARSSPMTLAHIGQELTQVAGPTEVGAATGTTVTDEELESFSEVEDCTICLEPLKLGSQTRLECCKQYYHTKCIEKWLEEGGTCPTCRRHTLLEKAFPTL